MATPALADALARLRLAASLLDRSTPGGSPITILARHGSRLWLQVPAASATVHFAAPGRGAWRAEARSGLVRTDAPARGSLAVVAGRAVARFVLG